MDGSIKSSSTMTQHEIRDPVVAEDNVQVTVRDDIGSACDADPFNFDFDLDEVFNDVGVDPVELVAFAEHREQFLKEGGESASLAIDLAVQEYNHLRVKEPAKN